LNLELHMLEIDESFAVSREKSKQDKIQ
jgi:hypothetical protein